MLIIQSDKSKFGRCMQKMCKFWQRSQSMSKCCSMYLANITTETHKNLPTQEWDRNFRMEYEFRIIQGGRFHFFQRIFCFSLISLDLSLIFLLMMMASEFGYQISNFLFSKFHYKTFMGSFLLHKRFDKINLYLFI